jgi:hypothetical protein
VIDRCLVRVQLLDERRARRQRSLVGVEVLEGERVGAKARADAQVGARDLVVGRAELARYVLDQARAPTLRVRAPRAHGEAKVVDALVVGPGHHASSGSSRGSSGHNVVWLGRTPKGDYL